VNLVERLSAFSSHLSGRQKAIAGGVAVVLVSGAAIGGALAATGSSDHRAAPPPVVTTPALSTTAPAPKPKPKPRPKPKPKKKPAPKGPTQNPLTGVGPVPKGPVIAVKIDDTASGRPQAGIDQADIVYIEQAEGGLSRLVAVFGTRKPTAGAVRSVRTSDPELLSQYGRIVLAASGGGGDSLPTLDHSILHPYIMDRGAPYYYRELSRASDYINVMLPLGPVSARLKTGRAKKIGFQWAKRLPGIKKLPHTTGVRTRVGSTDVTFRWSPGLNKYVRTIDGVAQVAADGQPVATPNVIVQFCKVTPHPGDIDVNGMPSQYTHSIGRGRVAIFRNGHRIIGLWSRASLTAPTVFKDKYGHVIPLSPGGAWVVLAATGAPLSS
jgi:hypothetical protein